MDRGHDDGGRIATGPTSGSASSAVVIARSRRPASNSARPSSKVVLPLPDAPLGELISVTGGSDRPELVDGDDVELALGGVGVLAEVEEHSAEESLAGDVPE